VWLCLLFTISCFSAGQALQAIYYFLTQNQIGIQPKIVSVHLTGLKCVKIVGFDNIQIRSPSHPYILYNTIVERRHVKTKRTTFSAVCRRMSTSSLRWLVSFAIISSSSDWPTNTYHVPLHCTVNCTQVGVQPIQAHMHLLNNKTAGCDCYSYNPNWFPIFTHSQTSLSLCNLVGILR